MPAPTHRTFNAKKFQLGHNYEATIDDDETHDFTWQFADALPSGVTGFAIVGTPEYGDFIAAAAPLVDTAALTVTLYVTGGTAGISSNIELEVAATSGSATLNLEVSFLLRCRDFSRPGARAGD